MMGMSFNGDGKYVGWSNLFDYTNIDTLRASEYLPMPAKTTFTLNETDGHDISDWANEIADAKDKVSEILAYAKLLNFLNDNGITQVKFDIRNNDFKDDIVAKLNLHENTKIPNKLKEMAIKNFISSHILNTVQNLTNMIGAYTPIEMEDLRDASNLSPKGEQSKRMTLMNPATKYLMQILNYTGKTVIGIAATGIKAAFSWHYYMNEILLNPNPGLIKRAKFDFITSRINGRSKAVDSFGNLDPTYDGTKIIKSIPDINWKNISEETKQLLLDDSTVDEATIISKLTVDLMQSQVLSAATDNAKELILAKINAGSKLAKMYLYMITLGFDVRDIVSFMTSDVASFIDDITETDEYNKGGLKEYEAISLLNGELPKSIFKKYLGDAASTLTDKEHLKEITEAFFNNDFNFIERSINKLNLEGGLKYKGMDLLFELKRLKKKIPEMNEQNIADLNDFKKVLEGANEFSNFGRILGINQGILTDEISFSNYLNFIKNAVSEREIEKGLIDRFSKKLIKTDEELTKEGYDLSLVGKFDPNKWLSDKDYREKVKEYYGNKLKVSVSIFDMIDSIDLFRESFVILDGVNVTNKEYSLINKVYDKITSTNPKSIYWNEKFKKDLQHAIRSKVLFEFFKTLKDYKLPYQAGTTIINSNIVEDIAKEDSFINFNSIESIATFKKVFEDKIIPMLKRGEVLTTDKKTGKIIVDDSHKSELLNNKFLSGLIHGDDKDMSLVKLNIDMMEYDKTASGITKMLQFLQGLKQLSKINMNGVSVAEWFMLYNLCTSHNNYGSNRLTTIFDSFINNDGKSFVIRDYYKFIGDLCYYASADFKQNSFDKTIKINTNCDIPDFELFIDDLFMMAAPTVSTTYGRNEPLVRLVTDLGLKYLEKSNYGYEEKNNKYFTGGNSLEESRKLNLIDNYFTFGGIAENFKALMMDAFENISSELKLYIKTLQKDNFLQYYRICK